MLGGPFALNPRFCACPQVNPGSIRREYTTLCFSADGQWLYAGTSSADVVTINVARVCVQMAHPVCSGGVGAMLLNAQGQVGGAMGG